MPRFSFPNSQRTWLEDPLSNLELDRGLFCDKLATKLYDAGQMDPKDTRFEEGCRLFDAGEYFEAHEVWEDIWAEAGGARRAFLQCLIQVAVALHHASNQNWRGTRKLSASALGYLEKGRSDSKPIDLEKLKDHIVEIEVQLQAIEAGTASSIATFKLPVLT